MTKSGSCTCFIETNSATRLLVTGSAISICIAVEAVTVHEATRAIGTKLDFSREMTQEMHWKNNKDGRGNRPTASREA